MRKIFSFMLFFVFSHGMAFAQDNGLCSLSKGSYIVNDDLNGDGSINEMDCLLSYVKGLLDAGIDNIEMSRNPKMLTIMSDFFSGNTVVVNGLSEYTTHLKPCISLIDDDAVDANIPSSYGSGDVGGYHSLLLPMLLSLGYKHNVHLVAGIAAEGHRIGLTKFRDDDDTYAELNVNGLLIKQLVEHERWEVLNHGMAGSIPVSGKTFAVDNINSELANTILTNGTYVGKRIFTNTMVLELSTGKWYQVNSTRTAWEEVNGQKFGQMYYQDYNTRKWFINRDFDWIYNWVTWFERAEELGLPFVRQIVHNGSTSSPVSILKSRNYAYCDYDIGGNMNYPPMSAAVKRRSGVEDNTSTNVPSATWKQTFLNYVNNCISTKSWMPLMIHHNEERFYNGYRSGLNYDNKDSEYEIGGNKYEWIHPLKQSEILSMNENNYWVNPPARLGISSWDEWIPASGTQLRVLYDVLDYALSNGVEIIAPSEGWNRYGNIVQIGVDANGQTYQRNSDFRSQYTDEEKSYLTIGADMSIRYSFTPVDYTDLSSSDITISPIAEVVYNGSAQTPEVIVRDGEIPLFNGIHYTVSYSNNINAGTATVTVTGKGHYTGTKTTYFTIKKNSVDISINSYGKGTYCCNEDLDFSGMGDDLKAYVATGFNSNTGTIWMTRVYDIPKGTGIFLIGKEGNYSVPMTQSTSYYRNMLVGTLDETYIPSSTDAFTNFYLTVEDDELKFCRIAGAGRTMSANRAYLQIPNNISNRPATSSVSSEEITISEYGKSTYCSENGLDFSGVTGLKAYTATGYTHESGTIWMTRVSDVPSGTGIFLHGAPGVYDIPTTTYDAQYKKNSYYENMLTGVLESTWVPSSTEDATNYYLTEENGVLKFCRIAGEGRTMSANRSYLQIPSSVLQADSRQLTLHSSAASADNNDIAYNEVIGVQLSGYDDITGISDLKMVGRQESDYYNLNGQKVAKPGKGIYIKNKKKIVSR